MKEHKKLYKSGKTWMVATLLTVGLAGGAAVTGTTNAHADEVTPAQATGTIPAGSQATDTNSELANAQSDAQKQQATIDSANAQLKDQQAQLSEAQGQQSQAQQELDQAKQAQQVATQNDPAVKDAQGAVDQAQQQVNNQQQVVNDAQTVVNNDAQNVQQKSDAVNQASQAVDQAQQAAVDATNQAASQKTEEAQNTINNLENQGKNQASQDLNNQINNVSGQVTDAQNDVNNTNAKIGDLQNQVKNLQDQEKNTQTDPNIVSINGKTVDLSKSLLENAVRNNLWDPNDENNVLSDTIYVMSDSDLNKSYDFHPLTDEESKEQEQEEQESKKLLLRNWKTVNALYYQEDIVNSQTGMTDAQKQELAVMLMAQINNARIQRGLKPFVMTEQKYQQAQVRASQHSANVLDHNEDDIMSAFGQEQFENLGYVDTNNSNLYWTVNGQDIDNGDLNYNGPAPTDCGSIGSDTNAPVTMLDMLNNADRTLSQMLNADASSDWGHRENFLEDTGSLSANAAFGFHYFYDTNTDSYDYVLTFDYDLSNPDSTPNMMDRIAQYQAMGPVTGDSHVVDNSAKINDLNNQISNLQNTLASQQSKLQNLQTQLQNLQAQKANVQFDLSQLNADQQAEYNNAKNTLDTINDWKNGQLANINKDGHVQDAINKLNQAKADWTSAKNTQAQDEAQLDQAKDGLAQLNQVLATKQAALQTAKDNANASANQAVKDAQAKLDKINGKIADLNKAIEATKATIQNAQAQLDKDNQKIADIKNGQKPAKPNTGKDSQSTTPTTPAKPDSGNKGTDTPAQPSSQPTTPTTPTTPAKPDNGNKGTDTPVTPSKPTDGKESGAATQGQYINVVSKDSVAAQAGIQAPAAPETTRVTFGSQMDNPSQNLPQTGDSKNDKAIAVAGLGILAATTFMTMAGATKRKHN